MCVETKLSRHPLYTVVMNSCSSPYVQMVSYHGARCVHVDAAFDGALQAAEGLEPWGTGVDCLCSTYHSMIKFFVLDVLSS